MAPRVKIGLPDSVENLFRGAKAVAQSTSGLLRDAGALVRKTKRTGRAGRRAVDELRKARPRVVLDLEKGEVGIDFAADGTEGDDES